MIKHTPELNDFVQFCQFCEEAINQNFGKLNKVSFVNSILNSKIFKNNQINIGILQNISSKSRSVSKLQIIDDKNEVNLVY